MKERPILFSTPMVQAILAGEKTMTRRVLNPQPAFVADPGMPFKTEDADPKGIINCPFGKTGDLLWVRETWRFKELETGEDFVEYAAGGEMSFPNDPNLTWSGNPFDGKWRPSIHMSKWASRIWLKVTDIRVGRLQDISELAAKKEGPPMVDKNGVPWLTAKNAFAALWDQINFNRGYGWDKNPWAWVVEFERTDRPQAAREGL